MTLAPIALPANQPAARFYAGGERIAAFRGLPTSEPNTPEDWVASTTPLFGETSVGTTSLGGQPLRDLVDADPAGWLGAAHVAAFGSDTGLLVKLLDAGQRLPVHAHPDDEFAAEFLGHAHGKSEAWYIVEPGEVHLGFVRDVAREELAALVAAQDVRALTALLHTRTVAAGDTVFVPAGVPHAIGEGVFLVEVQQPEDLSILLEWDGFDIDGPTHGHLGLGFERALDAVDLRGMDAPEVDALIVRDHERRSALPPEADAFFRIERVAADADAGIPAGFGVLVVLDGEGELRGRETSALRRGSVVLLPHGAGNQVVTGTVQGVVCRPPAA